MNPRNITKSREDIERYLLTKLRDVFWKFPGNITLTTTFKELNRYTAPDLIDFGFVMDIEEDLGIEITEEKAEAFDKQDVATVVAFIAEELGIDYK